MRLAHFVYIGLILTSAISLGQANPIPLINQPLVPVSAAPGGPQFTLTVNGTGFVSGATVNWNGGGLTTTFVTGSQLTAAVPASDIATANTATISVVNPPPGGGASNVVYFPVATPEAMIAVTPSAPILTSLSRISGILAGDFNGDGNPDFILSDSSDVQYVQNNGGGFSLPWPKFTAESVDATGDFNRDGNLDFVAHNDSLILLRVFLGRGDGSFTEVDTNLAAVGSNYLEGVVAGDFNGDGKLDVACYCGNSQNFPDAVDVLLGNGDGTFQPLIQSATQAAGSPVVAGDLNRDDKLDLITTTGDGLQILLGNGDGTFRQGQIFRTYLPPVSVLTADFNGDGKLDIAVSEEVPPLNQNGAVEIYLGNGDGSFRPPAPYYALPFGPARTLTLGDFNNDGKLDLASAGLGLNVDNPFEMILFYGNGDGTFQPSPLVSGTTGEIVPAYLSAVADLNGDGRLDMANVVSTDGSFDVLTQVPPGQYPVVNLSPNNITFGTQAIHTTSPPQTVTMSNVGKTPLTVSSITTGGADAADFAQTNNCGAQLIPGASCQISITFTPTAPGVRTGDVGIADNATGSPQIVNLAGNLPVQSPQAVFSPTSLTFAQLAIGSTSPPQTVTLTNGGQATLNISNVTLTGTNPGDFSQDNNCGSSLPALAICHFSVTFKPTGNGARSAALSVSDNAAGSPQSVALSGTGPDFSMSPSGQSSATISPGQTATYTVIVAPSGQFNQQVMLSCSGAPMGATCSVPNSVMLDGSSSTPITVTVKTAANAASLTQPGDLWTVAGGLAMWCGFPGLLVLSTSRIGYRNRRCRRFHLLALLCLVSIGITMSACGGSTTGTGGGGTSAGTYNLMVTGTFASGSSMLTHHTDLTLVVQ